MKTWIFPLICLLVFATGCSTPAIDSAADRNPASEFNVDLAFQEMSLNLTALGEPHFYYGAPDPECLQKFIDGKIEQSRKWKSPDAVKYAGDPNLAKNIIAAAVAAGVDPYIFAGLIHQESGDFVPHINGGGAGLTALTGIAIQDICLTLESTGCKGGYKTDKYAHIWKEKASDILESVFHDEKNVDHYPWREYCTTPPKNYCTDMCGLDNGSTCLKQARRGTYSDNRTSLFMGSYSLMNQLGASLKTGKEKGEQLKAAYLTALKNYNGHPKHKYVYPGNVFKKLASIKTSCPVAKTPTDLTLQRSVVNALR